MQNQKQLEFLHTFSISYALCIVGPRFSQLVAPICIVCQFNGFILLFSFQLWVLYFHFLKLSFLLLGISVFWFCLLNPGVHTDYVYL